MAQRKKNAKKKKKQNVNNNSKKNVKKKSQNTSVQKNKNSNMKENPQAKSKAKNTTKKKGQQSATKKNTKTISQSKKNVKKEESKTQKNKPLKENVVSKQDMPKKKQPKAIPKDNKKEENKVEKSQTLKENVVPKLDMPKKKQPKAILKDNKKEENKVEKSQTLKENVVSKQDSQKKKEVKDVPLEHKQEIKTPLETEKNRKKEVSKQAEKKSISIKISITKLKNITKTIGLGIQTFSKVIGAKISSFFKTIHLKIKTIEEKRIQKQKIKIEKTNQLEQIPVTVKKSKKNYPLIVASIVFLIIGVLLMIPYGISTYASEASGKVLEVPKFTKLKEECCAYSATFSSFRSLWSLKQDLEKIIASYQVLDCDGRTYYYNEKQDYTITEYGIKNGIILNEVNITYGKGNSCDIDTTFKKLELLPDNFSIKDAKKDGNYTIDQGTVYNAGAYDVFIENVKNGISSVLRIVTSTVEGDVIITDLEYMSDGKYKVTYDGTRDRNSTDHSSIIAYKYENIGIYKNKLYAYNGSKIKENSKVQDAYYLFDMPSK